MRSLGSLLAMLAMTACGAGAPVTRYYQLAAPQAAASHAGQITLAIDSLTTTSAYDDERMVYRLTPYRLDYYEYHRWSSPPGAMIGAYLEQAFQSSGRFRAVVHEASEVAPIVLGGRVVAIEEVDRGHDQWLGRVVVDLSLSDSVTRQVLWTDHYEETEPLVTQSPEGLARALSTAMQRIAQRAVPAVADLADQRPNANPSHVQ